MARPFSGIILSGGASSRMGTDKTALRLCGKTLLEWQVEKLLAAGAAEILLCGTAESDVPVVRCLPDLLPRRGPLGGIFSGLQAATQPCAMVLSADVPLLPVDALCELLAAHSTDVTLLQHAERVEPLIGIYNRALAPAILPLIQERSASVWALLDRCSWQTVTYRGDEDLLCNCNTPADFRKAEQIATRYGF